MSTPATTRLSLACRLIRIRAAITTPSSSSVRQHCATCAECRHYFAQAEQWESSLRREANVVIAQPPGTLESRILNAAKQASRPERRSLPSFSWAMAGIAAAAVAAVVTVQLRKPEPALPFTQTASVDDVLAVAKELPRQWQTVVQPGAAQLLNENPLQTEMASVSADTRSALSFLALNFLPSGNETSPASAPLSPPRSSS